MWNDVTYRSVNEARRFTSEENPTAASNGMFGEFIDRGYVSTQVLDICKITERSNNDPNKGVISLPRLLDDIRDYRHLLTRENFVSYDGLPYDHATAQQAYMDSLHPRSSAKPDGSQLGAGRVGHIGGDAQRLRRTFRRRSRQQHADRCHSRSRIRDRHILVRLPVLKNDTDPPQQS